MFQTIRMVAKTDLTVLITGGSGTGKDLPLALSTNIAVTIINHIIPVNCPTVPENILASELFGYKKGAFTHATQNKTGLFEEAHTGTIFLDEIGDITPSIQTKLLRVLQEKEIKPLGSNKSIHVDVRIIASTYQNLEEKIHQGDFREDFFYRLNVPPIEMPPLCKRNGNIPLLAGYLLQKHCAKLKQTKKRLSNELLELFTSQNWTGNIREMENIIVQGMLFSSSDEIFPRDVGMKKNHAEDCLVEHVFQELPYEKAKEETLTRFNQNYISYLLTETRGNVTQAAKQCGLKRQALQQIMRRYEIKADSFRNK